MTARGHLTSKLWIALWVLSAGYLAFRGGEACGRRWFGALVSLDGATAFILIGAARQPAMDNLVLPVTAVLFCGGG